ncbi:TetR family transcriptional regulator [Streptomyces sp. NBC_00257]|uniref:TetR/AcrR family transcriptional regulator n=1 Tax=Streptomyces TaxID=1883 RepID=UPI00225914AA|nr:MULTISPECIES: TetR family transcriptional regulator [unclassified Streptomyces]WSW03464.1 TetR family transcriptional regulator [Streptomyces sp. NBC_01005]WTC92967.1 TetR family transcriptional regulator [Streptomyces sp. NBC_01650]MCX4870196.1 TetR family transcriptional regulator [Streptomyces sp. NBC_00906]MCX4901360.1 TetR family transcriptional regulator [Streptomyces sp. NBC_00892]MCX5426605.1 TetR family transcriptional regulator [Streptomyces sp. NBC_00062]
MATGHTDPQRRDRILTATLDLIAEEGTAGVSHRKIAARADVPLGSMTYHFSGIDEVLREAFRHFTGHIVALFDEHLAAPADRDQAREAVADLIHALSDGSRRDLILTQELYTLAARRPCYRELTHEWMARSRSHLEKHFDPDTARQLDALIEGLTLHRALAAEPHDRLLTLDAVTRITGPSGATARTCPADHVAGQ